MAETNKQRTDRGQKLVYWRGHIEQWTISGETVSHYCREHGLSLCQFKYWQERVTSNQSSLFVEVETTTYQDYAPSERTIRVDISQGLSLTIKTKAFEPDLSVLMRVLSTYLC